MVSTWSASQGTAWASGWSPTSTATSSTTSSACWPNRAPRLEALVLAVGRAARRGEVFLLDFLGVEFRRALAHGLQHFFQRRRLAPSTAAWVDAGGDGGAHVGRFAAARLRVRA